MADLEAVWLLSSAAPASEALHAPSSIGAKNDAYIFQ